MSVFSTQYADLLETKIDEYYGESIRLMPYKEGGYLTGAQVDSSRPVVEGIGVPISKGGAMVSAPSAFISKRLEADFLLEVQKKYLTTTQEHDRVLFLQTDRSNLLCEISFIEPSANGRPVLHLMKVVG